MNRSWVSAALAALALAVSGCTSGHDHPGASVSGPPSEAVARLAPTEGNSVEGIVIFEPMEGAIHISARVTGLTPGKHGFHIHEVGDCSAPDAASAGGHFNPHGAEHAGPKAEMQHAGDLGNLEADEQGAAEYHAMLSYISLNEGDPNYIIGRSVIVHESEDDLVSQPTGAAGARLACGVIEKK